MCCKFECRKDGSSGLLSGWKTRKPYVFYHGRRLLFIPVILLLSSLYASSPLPLTPATSFTASTPTPHTYARHDLYLALTRPSRIWNSCSAVIWVERRTSDIESHVKPVFRTVAGGFPHLACRPESSLDRRACALSAFREVATQCRLDTCLLRRDCFIEAMRFASIAEETDPSLRNLVVLKRAWLHHLTHIGGIVYDASRGSDLQWRRCRDETGY